MPPSTMKLPQHYLRVFYMVLLIFLTSCVEDVDFDQVEDVTFTPVYVLDFVYAEFNTEDYIDTSLPPDTPLGTIAISDVVNYDLIGTDFAIENLERIELTIEISNTFATPFEFEFQFRDGAGQAVGAPYLIPVLPGNGEGEDPVNTPPNPEDQPVITLDNPTLVALASSRELYTEVRIINANSNLRGRIEIKSSAAYYVSYQP